MDRDAAPHTAMTVETTGSVASLTGTIPAATAAALVEGQHLVYVRTQDDQNNWGDPAEVILYADRQGPRPAAVSVSPTPNNGLDPDQRVLGLGAGRRDDDGPGLR